MVDLPEIPQRDIAPKAPTSSVTASQIASPYVELAGSLELASKELGGVANRAAEQAGLTAVTRDDQGNVQVERPFIIGDAALHYQHGVKIAAVADGENIIKTDLLAMRHKFENDPDGFAKASGAYTKEKVAQYQKVAGPEVGITLGRLANHASLEFHEGLLNQKERRDIANAKVSIETQILIKKNELGAILNQGAPDDSPPVQSLLQAIGALYGQLVQNPKFGVPKVVADHDLKLLQTEIQVARSDYRLAKIQEDTGPDGGTENALRKAENVLTDANLELTPPQRFSLHSRLVTGIMQREREDQTKRKLVDQKIDGAFDLAVQGYPLPASQTAALRTEVGMTNSPALAAKLSEVEQIAPIINSWKTTSAPQMEQTITGLEANMRESGALPGLVKLKTAAENILKNIRSGVEHDVIGWSNRTGTLPIPPLDWSPQGHVNIGTQLRERAVLAESAAAHYERPPQYFTPDERVKLTSIAAQGGQPMLDLAKVMVDGFGPKAGKAISEISKDAPVLAHIASLMQAGGSQGLIRDAATAVQLANDPTFKHPRWFEADTPSIHAAQNKVKVDQFGGAFVLVPQAGDATQLTAQKAFFTRSARNGYDPKLSDFPDQKEFKRALQEAAGARYEGGARVAGGVDAYTTSGTWYPFSLRKEYKVIIPTNVKADEFKTIINAIRDEDLAGSRAPEVGRPYMAGQLRNAIPVATRGGYAFLMGDPFDDNPKYLAGSNGQPFILDLHAMEPTLRKRVPNAYAN